MILHTNMKYSYLNYPNACTTVHRCFLCNSCLFTFWVFFNLMKGTICACNCPAVLANSTLQFLDLWFFESFCFVSLFFAFSEVDYLKNIIFKKYREWANIHITDPQLTRPFGNYNLHRTKPDYATRQIPIHQFCKENCRIS